MSELTTVSIDKKDVKCDYKKVNIFDLTFDPENPRIASILSKCKGVVTEEYIDKTLWDRNPTHQLKRNIQEAGGLQHPIIVYGNKVIEGNTRLCCYRHLYKEQSNSKNGEKWKYIDCKVLLGKLTKKEINILLGNEHIIGKIQWEPYEKGYWMTKMLEEEKYSWDDLQKIVGMSKTTIENHIAAYKTMVEENVEDTSKFSHFLQLHSNAKIRRIKNTQDPEVFKKAIIGIKNDQFPDARDIRKIPTIYKNNKAIKRMEKGEAIPQVYSDLIAKHPTIESPLIRSIEDISKRINEMTVSDRDEINNSSDKSKIKKLTKDLIKLCKKLDIDLGKKP